MHATFIHNPQRVQKQKTICEVNILWTHKLQLKVTRIPLVLFYPYSAHFKLCVLVLCTFHFPMIYAAVVINIFVHLSLASNGKLTGYKILGRLALLEKWAEQRIGVFQNIFFLVYFLSSPYLAVLHTSLRNHPFSSWLLEENT